MKDGRGRQYGGYNGIIGELDFLQELRERAHDLIADLDETVLNTEHDGHTIQHLFSHMMSAEVKWFSQLLRQTTTILPTTVETLDQYTRMALASFDLGDKCEIGPFKTIGDIVRHLQWHWTYHSGQIGLIRRALGQTYKWNFDQ